MMKKELRELIARGRTQKAIESLLRITSETEDSTLRQDILLQSARFWEYKRDKRKDGATHEQGRVALSLLHDALLDIIEELPDDVLLPSAKKSWRRTRGKRVSYALGIIIILVGLAKLTGIAPSLTGREAHPQEALQLTVYVGGPQGKQDIVLENTGHLIVDFGNDRRKALIGENGRTNFGEIPAAFYHQSVPIQVVAEGFEVANPDSNYVLDGNPIYFEVIRNPDYAWIKGIIRDKRTLKAIAGATIMVDLDTTFVSDSLGRMRFHLPEDMRKDHYELKIAKENYRTYSTNYFAQSSTLEVLLEKE